MKIANVPALIRITLKGRITDIPTNSVFFFPEGKNYFNLLDMREILKEMEKMSDAV
jgi:late competence protein required for DNA uptake (superfamily II DNA/RNA helicase)